MLENPPDSPRNMLNEIKEFIRLILKALSERQSPQITIPHYKIYCTDGETCKCHSQIPFTTENLSFHKDTHFKRIVVLMSVLEVVVGMLQANHRSGKWHIMYMTLERFLEAQIGRALDDICGVFKCGRHHLNVFSTEAYAVGPLTIKTIGQEYDFRVGQMLVPADEILSVNSSAKCILVVEKLTVVRPLRENGFLEENKCIVLTGKGFPDVDTRRFLNRLIKELKVPVCAIMDCDPGGVDVFCNYKYGSQKMTCDAEELKVKSMEWGGLFPLDVRDHKIPKECCVTLTQKDENKINNILKRCYLANENVMRLRLKLMLQRKVKFSIDVLSHISPTYWKEKYIPLKLRELDERRNASIDTQTSV